MVWLDIKHVPVVCKHFVTLYQASIKDKSKYDETHAAKNALVKANVEINNVLFKKISLAHEVAKSLQISDFFEDLDNSTNASNRTHYLLRQQHTKGYPSHKQANKK